MALSLLTFRSAQQLFISMLMRRCTSVTIWHAQTAHAHAVHVLVQIWAAVVEVTAGMPYNLHAAGTDVGLAACGWVFFWTRLALLPAAPAPGRLCFVALLSVRDVVR